MRLEEIMSAPAETILPTASAAEAAATMRLARIQHLVVASGSRRILGVLCAHDVRQADPGSTVDQVMSVPAVTLSAKSGVQEAARLLRQRNIGCLPLVDQGRLVGVVTTSDLLGLLGKGVVRIQPRTKKWTLPKRGPTHRPEPRRP